MQTAEGELENVFRPANTQHPQFILLVGSQGTGKSTLVKKMSSKHDINFMAISPDSVIGTSFEESVQKTRAIFDKARSTTPGCIFIDKIHCLLGSR